MWLNTCILLCSVNFLYKRTFNLDIFMGQSKNWESQLHSWRKITALKINVYLINLLDKCWRTRLHHRDIFLATLLPNTTIKLVLDCTNNTVIGLDEWLLLLLTCSATPLVPLNPVRVCAIIASNANAEWVHNGPKHFTCCSKWVILWMFMVSLPSPINNTIFIIDQKL